MQLKWYVIILILLLCISCPDPIDKNGEKDIIRIKTEQIPDGLINTLYDTEFTATGGNEKAYRWSLVSGHLPPGITLISTGRLIGIPGAKGDYQFKVNVTDDENQAGYSTFSLHISSIKVSPYTLIPAKKNELYYEKLEISGGEEPYTFSLISGSLPANLILNDGNGEITGITGNITGIYPFIIKVTDNQGSNGIKEYSLNVIDNDPVIITRSECPAGVVSHPYFWIPSVTGGSGEYIWEFINGILPEGLVFNSSDSLISGMPLEGGIFPFILQAKDRENPLNYHAIEFFIIIYNQVDITTDSCKSGIKDESYFFQFTVTGGSGVYNWEMIQGQIPPGCNFNIQPGAIDGTPTVTGNYNFTIEVKDANNPDNYHSHIFTLPVYEKIEILPHTFPSLKANKYFSEILSSQGGSGVYRWSIADNPYHPDIDIMEQEGILYGYPSRPGSSGITIKCEDVDNSANYDVETFTMEVENLEWTIMVYVDGDNNLETYAFIDLNEMEAADLRGTGIKVITLIDGIDGFYTGPGHFPDTRLYEVMYDWRGEYLNTGIVSKRLHSDELGITESGSTELNMADTNTLINFITYTKNTFTADNYGIVLWDHGDGWPSFPEPGKAPARSIIFDSTSNNDKLATKEVGDALRGRDISFIGFDACLMNMVEVAYELRGCCEIMTASEELESGDGWEYHVFLNSFKEAAERTARSLGAAALSSYSYHYSWENATLSVIDLTQMDSLISALDTFIINLEGSSFSNIYAKVAKGSGLQRFYSDYNSTYERYMMSHMDLWDFAGRLISITGAQECITILDEMILYHYTSGEEMADAHGISIYFPMYNIALAPSEKEYREADLVFLDNSRWDEYIYQFWRGNDIHEPNDNFLTAKTIQLNTTVRGYIQFYSTQDAPPDADFYHFNVTANRNVQILLDLHSNSFLDLVLELYTGLDETTPIKSVDTGGYGKNETMTYSAKKGYDYYIKVYEKNNYIFDRSQYYSLSLF
ncbi:MAG: hypothetical protein JXB88_04880 [Spirochaetales bacterium]|nr:hypothetical protein [Spirochaetales bacterium]